MTKAQILIKDVWEDLNLVNPVTIGQRLDERLDEAVINIKGSKLEYIQPTTRVILITDVDTEQQKEHYFIVANDKSVELPIGSKKYNHELSLIEATKLLEGIQCQTLTFTNSNGMSYGKDNIKAVFTASATYSAGGISGAFPKTKKTSNDILEAHSLELTLPSHNEVYSKETVSSSAEPNLWLAWKYFNETKEQYKTYTLIVKKLNNDTVKEIDGGGDDSHTLTLTEYGQYKVIYTWYCKDTTSTEGAVVTITYDYEIVISKYYAPLQKWNCKEVIERTLRLAEPLFGSQKPRFKLDNEWAEKLEGVLAPEFSMTSANLREQLKQVGGFAHAEPRLKDFETITFDKYGDNEEITIDKPYISQGFGGSINDYAVQIDTYAENLVNASSEIAIVEPFAGGYRSLRTEEVNVRVNEENGVIQTTFPIYAVKEVKVKNGDAFEKCKQVITEEAEQGWKLAQVVVPFDEKTYKYEPCCYQIIFEREV